MTVALVLVAQVLLYPTPAGASTDTLDQATQTNTWTDVWRIGGGYRPEMAQIVTAGMYGTLDRVSLYLNDVDASGPVSVSIQTVIGGAPSGNQIGSGEIPVSALPSYGSPQYVDAPISGSAFVAPGNEYAIVVSPSGAGAIQWYSCADDVYTGGSMLINEGSGWSSWPADAMFQTYVIPDTVDQSQTKWSDVLYLGDGNGNGGQTFTPGLSGAIDRLHLGLSSNFAPPNGPVEVGIQTTVKGYPSGIEIGHGEIPVIGLPSNPPNWVEVRINPVSTTPVQVTAGTQYAIVVSACCAVVNWLYWLHNTIYMGGDMVYNDGTGWTGFLPYFSEKSSGDAMFQTYVATPVVSAAAPPPAGIMPCSSGVCPAAAGWITPRDSTARVTSYVHFHERPDGKVYGILDFNNSRTGNVVLQGFVTEWAAWRLKVTTFACTDEHAITVAGTYTPKRGTSTPYQLTLSAVRDGIGTFTLTAGDYTYTLSHNGIVDVRCPPIATP